MNNIWNHDESIFNISELNSIGNSTDYSTGFSIYDEKPLFNNVMSNNLAPISKKIQNIPEIYRHTQWILMVEF
jgi:hypothetical protein